MRWSTNARTTGESRVVDLKPCPAMRSKMLISGAVDALHARLASSCQLHRYDSCFPTMLAPFEIVRVLIALTLATLLAKRGYSRNSLSLSGAAAAFLVGFLSWASSTRFGITLISFYLIGTRATRYKAALKKQLEDGYTTAGANRDAKQVLASSLPAVIIAIVYAVLFRFDAPVMATFELRSSLLLMYLLFFAACAGDTFASELGLVLPSAGEDPRLAIAPWKRVPRGTNGGVSWQGNVASGAGGFVMGLVFFVAGPEWSISQLWLILVGTLGGLMGSFVDSVLGALLQASWLDENSGKVLKEAPQNTKGMRHICGKDILSGEAVNILAASVTMCMAPSYIRLFMP